MNANSLLARSLKGFNHVRNQRLSKDRKDRSNTSYNLATEIEDYFRGQGIQPYTEGWEGRAAALDEPATTEIIHTTVLTDPGVIDALKQISLQHRVTQ